MRKVLVSLFLVLALMLLMVPLVSGESLRRPASLEVWKEISCVENEDGYVTVSSMIYIMNEGEGRAYIFWVYDGIQAKWKNEDWTYLVLRIEITPYDGLIIDPGETEEIELNIRFRKGMFKAYRNVLSVQIVNHPTGYHWFHCRESFEVPEVTING